MRVSRAQAEENRRHVVDVASRLFREHGFDGIGLKDLMESAGMTQGAFYKQFTSKDDLVVEASAKAMEHATARWESATAANPDDPLKAITAFYLSLQHSQARSEGCPFVALGADASRQGPDVKKVFEEGIERHIGILTDLLAGASAGQSQASRAISILSTMIGAVTLARAVDNAEMSKKILKAAADSILASSAS